MTYHVQFLGTDDSWSTLNAFDYILDADKELSRQRSVNAFSTYRLRRSDRL